MTAVGLGIFCAVMAVAPPQPARRGRAVPARGLAVAARGDPGVLLAYPLYVQFFGPQSYHGLPEFVRGFGADLGSSSRTPGESVAGDARDRRAAWPRTPTEENAFFGWALVVLFFGLVCLDAPQRPGHRLGRARAALRRAVARPGRSSSTAATPASRAPGRCWRTLPVLHSAVPTRLGAGDHPDRRGAARPRRQRARDLARPSRPPGGRSASPWRPSLAMALLPLLPTPLRATRLDPVPEFVTSGGVAAVRRRRPQRGHPAAARHQLRRTRCAGPPRPGWTCRSPGATSSARTPARVARAADARAVHRAVPADQQLLRRRSRGPAPIPPITAAEPRRPPSTDLRYWRAGVVILGPAPAGRRNCAAA